MSIFSDTMTHAISEYRLLLRRHLTQVERMTKLQKLKLRDEQLYDSDVTLFEAGRVIIADMETNEAAKPQGYYSYSGMHEFCTHLKKYMSNYEIENGKVVHRAQKASRAMLKAIQLMSLPRENLNDEVSQQLCDCNQMIVEFGSDEQCEFQLQALSKQQATHPGFYTRIIAHFESLLSSRCSEAA